MDKMQLLAQLIRARDEWELLINHVGAARVGISGVSGHWSVKSIVAHIMIHEQYLADRLGEIARDEIYYPCETQAEFDAFLSEFGYPDLGSPLVSEEAANEWIHQKYKNIGMQELVTAELHAYETILSEIRALPETKLDRQGLIQKIKSVTMDHYRHHGSDIRKRFKRSLLRKF